MRIFRDFSEAVNEVQRDLASLGTIIKSNTYQNKDIRDNEDFLTRELQGYSFAVADSSSESRDKIIDDDSKEWNKAEFETRLINQENPGSAWILRPHVWKQFLNEDGKFCYTYGERINDQATRVIAELKKNPSSRQLIIELYDAEIDKHNWGGKKRIPCSMHYQLMLRNNKLDILYVMRSCDIMTHFKNDMWQACTIRDFIAKAVGVEPGKFMMQIGSLHAFKKDLKGVF